MSVTKELSERFQKGTRITAFSGKLLRVVFVSFITEVCIQCTCMLWNGSIFGGNVIEGRFVTTILNSISCRNKFCLKCSQSQCYKNACGWLHAWCTVLYVSCNFCIQKPYKYFVLCPWWSINVFQIHPRKMEESMWSLGFAAAVTIFSFPPVVN